MVKMRTQQIKAYKLDISKTGMDGAFLCPSCGIKISPDDRSDDNYIIQDTVMKNNEMDEVIIYCKRCLSVIQLSGFSEISKRSQDRLFYFNHI